MRRKQLMAEAEERKAQQQPKRRRLVQRKSMAESVQDTGVETQEATGASDSSKEEVVRVQKAETYSFSSLRNCKTPPDETEAAKRQTNGSLKRKASQMEEPQAAKRLKV
ncbi:hypothetical protein TWF696_002030 [Orbilia brochopaga]|uniref:Uncharacterized protein n=1 Tax=Orbilia brochopaga TaxID=3140254 RepID=A0AAV9U6S2_9PEZI